MTKQKITAEIKLILLQMGIPAKAMTKQASYYKDLGLDSLDVAELMMEFELRFGLQIQCTAIEKINTIQDTVDYVSGELVLQMNEH